jgi:hypothetical protein
LLYRLRLGSIGHAQRDLQDQYRPKVVHDARTRRGLPVGPEIAQFPKRLPIRLRESWAYWSRLAFHGGHPITARCAWRAIRSDPLAVSSWKAVLRGYFRRSRGGQTLAQGPLERL